MTILSTIMGVESSGGHNVTQGNIGDINNRTGDLAQGYFQITGGTWAQFGGLAGLIVVSMEDDSNGGNPPWALT